MVNLKLLSGFPSQMIGLQILKSTLKTVRDSELHIPSYAYLSPKAIKNTIQAWVVKFTMQSAQVIKPCRLLCEFHNAICPSTKKPAECIVKFIIQALQVSKTIPSFPFKWGSIPNILKPNKHAQNHLN